MKATLKLPNGKEITVTVTDEQLKDLEKSAKKTGYERVDDDETYYSVDSFDAVGATTEAHGSYFSENHYSNANYYSDKTAAENNARADTLKRKVRRFAVEHREHKLDWNDWSDKFYIEYNYEGNALETDCDCTYRGFGKIYFDSEETADAAIEEFKDELLWYFTEYKDSL